MVETVAVGSKERTASVADAFHNWREWRLRHVRTIAKRAGENISSGSIPVIMCTIDEIMVNFSQVGITQGGLALNKIWMKLSRFYNFLDHAKIT